MGPNLGTDGPECHIAVVDIGSNSVRLVVYDRLSRAPFPRFNEKSLCRLGAGLAETGRLSAECFRRALEAVRRFRAISDAMGVSRTDVIATEAVRRAANGAELVAAIRRETGLDARVLAGAEEARFAATGVLAGFYQPAGLVGDMGGGSLELAEVAAGEIGDCPVSLPLGSLPVHAMLARGGRQAREAVDTLLKTAPDSLRRKVFYAVGGGWRALARMHMEAIGAPVRVAHAYTLNADDARRFAKRVWRMDEAKLAVQPGVAARRRATLPAAALILDRVLKHLAPERVVFSALGVREGWLYSQLPPEEQALDPLLEGARGVGLPQARVPRFAAALERWTDGLFAGETAAQRRLRVAACALTDIGWRDHASVKAAESFRRLVQFPLIGLDHEERVFIAAVIFARYAGRLNDPALSPAIELLPSEARRRAVILGRTMLLGHRVSGSVPDILASARLQVEADRVRLAISPAARVPDSEVVADRLGLVAGALRVRRTEIVEA